MKKRLHPLFVVSVPLLTLSGTLSHETHAGTPRPTDIHGPQGFFCETPPEPVLSEKADLTHSLKAVLADASSPKKNQCKSTNSAKAPINTSCTTDAGVTFVRYQIPNGGLLGMGWKDTRPNGKIWLDLTESFKDPKEAIEYCSRRGGQALPSEQDFKFAEKGGFRELFRHVREPSTTFERNYWTSTQYTTLSFVPSLSTNKTPNRSDRNYYFSGVAGLTLPEPLPPMPLPQIQPTKRVETYKKKSSFSGMLSDLFESDQRKTEPKPLPSYQPLPPPPPWTARAWCVATEKEKETPKESVTSENTDLARGTAGKADTSFRRSSGLNRPIFNRPNYSGPWDEYSQAKVNKAGTQVRGEVPDQIVEKWEKGYQDAKNIIGAVSGVHRLYDKLYDTQAGVAEGFTVREHSTRVLSMFEAERGIYKLDAIKGKEPMDLTRLMKFALALHDIGKPVATVLLGDQSLEHAVTVPHLKEVLTKLKFSEGEIKTAVALVENNALGRLFHCRGYMNDEGCKGSISPEQAYRDLKMHADRTPLSVKDFFKLQSLFYASDAGSYPSLHDTVFVRNASGKLVPHRKSFAQLSELVERYGDRDALPPLPQEQDTLRGATEPSEKIDEDRDRFRSDEDPGNSRSLW